MKIKFLTLLVCGLLFFSCSSEEEAVEPTNDVNFKTETTENSRSGRNNYFPCPVKPCEPNYVFPTPQRGVLYKNFYVTYDPNEVRLEEIPCIRMNYFECFDLMDIVFPQIQSNNPYEELWQVELGKPDQGLDTTLCNDPRTNTSCSD